MKYRTFSFLDKVYERLAPKAKGLEEDTKLLVRMLESDKPCMISRFGSTELQTLCYIKYYPLSLPLKRRTFYNIQYASGFFPVTHKNLKAFYSIYRQDVKELDLLVSWRIEELLFGNWLRGKEYVRKTTLDQFYQHEHPWTSALEGKRVLVVHPFAETIEKQYRTNRENLFGNPETLPEFACLETVKAVQSVAGNTVEYDSWFDALEWMKREIDKKDFDVALLGCGAYALPLAAHIKRMGHKAIHMGGILQFLFGIQGKRYLEDPETAKYINPYFVSPSVADRPKEADKVEGGCYW